MAAEDTDKEAEATDEEQSGGGKSKLPLIGAVLAVLAIGGYFAMPYVMNMISPPAAVETEDVAGASEKETGKKAENKIDKSKPALFTSLHPPLVINFRDSFGDAHFMQITLEIMARDQGIIDEVKNYVAVIRNSLILMFGSVDYDEVTTRAGKEQMLADALLEIQKIIEDETGETGIEAVYFTSLIIQ